MVDRPTGYYWVKMGKVWQPMLWIASDLEWYAICSTRCRLDSHMDQIGPKLIKPEECDEDN